MTNHRQRFSADELVPKASAAFDPVFSPAQVAENYGIPEVTLQRWRSNGLDGPPFVKLGPRRIGYRQSDINSWLASRVVTSTSDARQRGLS